MKQSVAQSILRGPGARLELVALLLVAWLAMVAVPWSLGGIGLSWDALNHHVYLGWTADQPRFDRDLLAASYQSFQFPYVYWPLYKLVEAGVSGTVAGTVLNSLHLLVIPPLWMLARTCIAEPGWYGVAMRWMAVALGMTSGVVLSMLDTTANDLLAAIPLIWAMALAVLPMGVGQPSGWTPRTNMLLSGLLAGIAVAFKLSNGPLALVLPLLWVAPGRTMTDRLNQLVAGSVATLLAFFLVYGYWGWQLWTHFGNPVYPFYDPWFEPVRQWFGSGR